MSKQLKPVASMSIVYRGLQVQVPVGTTHVWIHVAKNGKSFVAAASECPKWDSSKKRYTGVSYETVQEIEGPFSVQEIFKSLETEDKVEEVKSNDLVEKALSFAEAGNKQILTELLRLLSGMVRSIEPILDDAENGETTYAQVIQAVLEGTPENEPALQAMLNSMSEQLSGLANKLESDIESKFGFESADAVYVAAGLASPREEACDCPFCTAEADEEVKAEEVHPALNLIAALLTKAASKQ